MVSPATASPTANPTWYGDIRDMFTSTDVDHMRKQGLDLATYTEVVTHAGNIYQQLALGNMPPHPNQWSPDWVATFLNWMTNGYPKGTPSATPTFMARTALAAVPSATRVRKEITSLSVEEIDQLKQAFTTIKNLDPSNPNSYFAQASIHWYPPPNTYCMHHVPGYNPWHRAYMLSFENALRAVPGCENITLPYWDITTPFPDVLKAPPFDSYVLQEDVGPGYPKGYTTTRFTYDTIAENLLKYQVAADIDRAMTKTDWEDFHGFWSDANYNTIIAAHDSGHNSIGETMQNQEVAAFDPVFWFFHCNWDRLYWAWQKKMIATDLNGLLTTIDKQTDLISYQLFTDQAVGILTPFGAAPLKLDAVSTISSDLGLDVDYSNSERTFSVDFAVKTQRSVAAGKTFSVEPSLANVRVSGINRLKIPGSFSVHLLKDEKIIASRALFQPVEAEKCANCVSNALVHFDFELPVETVLGGTLSVSVEPANKNFIGDRFPQKLMGNPTIDVQLLLRTE